MFEIWFWTESRHLKIFFGLELFELVSGIGLFRKHWFSGSQSGLLESVQILYTNVICYSNVSLYSLEEDEIVYLF